MNEQHFDSVSLTATHVVASAPIVKAWSISLAIHAGALGLIVGAGGLYEDARIGARGGPMSVEAISSPASIGDLTGEVLADAPLEPLNIEPPAEVVQPLIAPTDSPPEPIERQPEPASPDSTSVAAFPELVDPLKPVEQSKKIPPATAEQPIAQTAVPKTERKSPAHGMASLPSAGSIGHAGNDGASSPTFSANAPIVYPAEAVRLHQEGEVLLRVRIDSQGRVVAVELVTSSGVSALDKAALEGVATWHAEPARLLGSPMESTALLPIRFRLQ